MEKVVLVPREDACMKKQRKVLLFTLGTLPLLVPLLTGQTNLSPAKTQNKTADIEFVTITGGEFLMGCSESDNACKADEKPAHRVRITKPFEIGKFEITQAQWEAVMGSNPSVMRGATRPVESISKGEALEFLNRLNTRNDGYRYRLPTEAEWEYAARAGFEGSIHRQARRHRLVCRQFRRRDTSSRPKETECLGPLRHAGQCPRVGAGLLRRELLHEQSRR
jgi:formylglycine-generating enzyme required for sulfatase activity